MDTKTRICLWIILIGLVNFLVYTILYVFLGGEAVNGWVTLDPAGQKLCYLQSGLQVSFAEYLYSGVHSISIWITVGAVMLAMLTLAKDRIVSSMHATVVHGRTFITILATIIAFTVAIITIWFILQFSRGLCNPRQVTAPEPPSAQPVFPHAINR